MRLRRFIFLVFGGAVSPLLWALLHLVTQRPQSVGELLKAKFQPGFHRAKGSMRCSGNFPMAESLEKRELERLALKSRENSHALL